VPSITLNVLIHGMYAIDVGDHEITLYPPSIPDGSHVYMAGTWEQEEALSPGEQYRLTGVAGRRTRPALADLHPNHNAVFQRQLIDDSVAFCSIVLPFPDLITPLRLTKRTEEYGSFFLNSPPELYKDPQFFPSVVALTYQSIGLQPLRWTPNPQNSVVNLHFWAMPPDTTGPDHPVKAFDRMKLMIGCPNLQPNRSYKEMPPLDLAPQAPGICCDEEKTLHERRTPSAASVGAKFMGSIDCASLFMY
jgi:hypothetical protein